MKSNYEIVDNIIYLELTQNKVALIDKDMIDIVKDFKWYAMKDGGDIWYAIRKEKGKKIRMHRVIFESVNGPLGDKFIDHIDHDGLNNRLSNLRAATNQENQMNARKQRIKNGKSTSSKFKGVCFHKQTGKWHARITIDGKKKHLGSFTNEEDAARAYNEGMLKSHADKKSFLLLNIIPEDEIIIAGEIGYWFGVAKAAKKACV